MADMRRTADMVPEVHAIRHDLRMLRRTVSLTRDVISALARAESGGSQDDTYISLRNCHDRTVQLLEALDTNRELASSLMELHFSNASMCMNEVMKVLTIIATIFIPAGFIAGLYGMNFDVNLSSWNVPELRWRYGYPFTIGVVSLTAGGLMLFFRRKGWLGERNPRSKEGSAEHPA